jgi:hypothetical protein
MKLYQSGLFLFLFIIFSFAADAQTAALSPAPQTDVQDRVKQLEAQVEALQVELKKLKEIVSVPAQQNQTVAAAPKENAETQIVKTTAAKVESKTETKPEAKPQTQQKHIGVDLGGVRLTPYGTIYFNAFNNSSAVNNADVPLFAAPTGQGGASASVRQTRLGLRFDGAKLGNANLGGVIEADFFGGIPAVGIGENFGVVRIRLANAKLNWENTSLTVGQDWMPFAPVNPTSLAAAAIPQMAAAGNIWARIPQIRVDHKMSDNITVTGAILAPQTGDYPTASSFFLQPNSGAAARTPFFQSRISLVDKNWLGTKKAGNIGLSAHYGRSRVLVGTARNGIDSTGVAADWNFPLHSRVRFSGEAFFGRNLAGFQAGIFQNYVVDFAYRNGNSTVAGGVRAIGTRGGWAQIGFTPDVAEDRLTFYGSFGIDDPRDEDLVSFSRTNYRKQNRVFAASAIYRFSPQFQIGAEYRRFETQYLFTSRRIANHINLTGAFNF